MNPLIVYILKVNLALVVFYLLYAALLRRDTFLCMRRWYFIVIILFSLSYPLFTIDALQGKHLFDFSRNRDVQTRVEIGTPMVGVIVEDEPAQSFLTWENAVGGLAVVISVLLLARFGGQLLSILILKRKSEEKEIFDTSIYYLKEDMPPFSFFHWIFINTDNQTSDELQQILLHEKTHAAQGHSFDILLNELLCISFWWNPIVWLIRNEVKINLEYLADSKVLQQGVDTKGYQYLLLRMTNHETAVQIVNNFNVSQLKQRIIMMNKLKSPGIKMARYAWFIPLACMFLAVNSVNAEQKSEVTVGPQKKETKQTAKTQQQKTEQLRKKVTEKFNLKNADEVFVVVEQQPEFQGGQKALMNYLSENIKYPEVAFKSGIQGRVITQFVVNQDGSISEVNVIRGVDPVLDKEAIRVVSSMPNWKPGIQKGKAVRVKYTLPIIFRLQGDAKKDQVAPQSNAISNKQNEDSDIDEEFIVVEQQPEFPGGQKALMEYLFRNIKYPKEAHEQKIQGRVIMQFVIEKDGSLSEIRPIRNIHPTLDNEAIRIVSAMPKWKPGVQRGKTVRVRYTLPIVFRLEGAANQPKVGGTEDVVITSY